MACFRRLFLVSNSYLCPKNVGKKKSKPFLENLLIEDIGAEGKAIARKEDYVIFTQYAVPGDIVDLQVVKKRSRYGEAKVVKYKKLSEIREIPVCDHFGVCGGCKWQILPYTKQLEFKQKQVFDQLKRIAKVDLPGLNQILGSNESFFYRNKLEFTFSNKKWLINKDENGQENDLNALGFHVPGFFDKVLHIDKCWLQPDPSNKIRNFIYEYAVNNKLSFFDIKNKTGLLRTLIIRNSSIGELMVIISFYTDDENSINNLLSAIRNYFPAITSLMYVINSKANDTIADQEILLFSGRDHIYEEMEGLQFKIGPKSFYQTNSQQAYGLYKVAREFADLNSNDNVYDLYTGTGTIANFVARDVKKVVGIEYIPEAIEDAKVNSKINNIRNTSFFAGDIKSVLNEKFFQENGFPDVIITDPPRAGMHADVVKSIIDSGAKKVVYVSCNPATQARDIALMSNDYMVKKIQPVDMFPQTHHVENVVLMVRK